MGAGAVLPRLPEARPSVRLLRDEPRRAREGRRRGRRARPQRVREADLLDLLGRGGGEGHGAEGVEGVFGRRLHRFSVLRRDRGLRGDQRRPLREVGAGLHSGKGDSVCPSFSKSRSGAACQDNSPGAFPPGAFPAAL